MLVIDTDEETCGNIKTLMGDVGVATDLVHNMEEALSLLEKNNPEPDAAAFRRIFDSIG